MSATRATTGWRSSSRTSRRSPSRRPSPSRTAGFTPTPALTFRASSAPRSTTFVRATSSVAEKLVYHAPTNSYLAPHFVDYVLAELRQLGFQPGVQQLNVKTTLDWERQQMGQQVVSTNLDRNLFRDRNGQLSSGLIAIQPTTGDILVMVGSPNYNADAGQINYTTIPRNMGSSMKPYTYGAVINARAATVDTPVYDVPSPLVYNDAYSTTKFYNHDA